MAFDLRLFPAEHVEPRTLLYERPRLIRGESMPKTQERPSNYLREASNPLLNPEEDAEPLIVREAFRCKIWDLCLRETLNVTWEASNRLLSLARRGLP